MINGELEKLNLVKKIFEDSFAEMPAIDIIKCQHYYLTVNSIFVLTFNNEGNFILFFNDRIDPLLAARISQLLTENNINFILQNNFYFSPHTLELYFDEDIKEAKKIDLQKEALLSKPTAQTRH